MSHIMFPPIYKNLHRAGSYSEVAGYTFLLFILQIYALPNRFTTQRAIRRRYADGDFLFKLKLKTDETRNFTGWVFGGDDGNGAGGMGTDGDF